MVDKRGRLAEGGRLRAGRLRRGKEKEWMKGEEMDRSRGRGKGRRGGGE